MIGVPQAFVQPSGKSPPILPGPWVSIAPRLPQCTAIVFECSGAAPAILHMHEAARPGGAVVLVGMPVDPVRVDIVGLQAKELRVETVFRYANVYDRAIALIASGKVDLKPLISGTIPFEDSVTGFDRAVEARETDVKLQILMPK